MSLAAGARACGALAYFMVKYIAGLGLATGMLAAARFSVWPARSYRTWWVALGATELGHLWLWPALALAVWTGRAAMQAGSVAERGLAGAASLLAGLAVLGFARPAWSAWRMSARVDQELTRTFAAGPALWSWRRLGRWPTAAERAPVASFDAAGRAVDFYPARSGAKELAAPCVILVHGGGWDGGNRRELAAFDHWLATHGVAVAAFDYRLAPAHPWPAQREDLLAVVAWVRANAARLKVDPERLTLVGRSAGAQIAAATAYGGKLPGVRAVVALYGVHNLEFVWSIRSETDSLNSHKLMNQYLGGAPEADRVDRYRTGSAELLAHADAPPTLIVHGELDELVWCRHSEKLAAALAAVGAPHVFVRLPWATHAGEANLHGPSGQLITGAVLRVARA